MPIVRKLECSGCSLFEIGYDQHYELAYKIQSFHFHRHTSVTSAASSSYFLSYKNIVISQVTTLPNSNYCRISSHIKLKQILPDLDSVYVGKLSRKKLEELLERKYGPII